ncbi:tRNA (cytidine(34)-2'-O)-methyltransferase [Candidatus Mycoplasma mahonii]|uniref:tRNA (cytidine(34)-2'-O)-methyltransferase n=1 Tax=Candidatus Mycoplasma mahonii TaxID=3004105 RepID=UPI0026EBAB10|nr:tRNA (cytidine(34)-2'-O)-methyltransferase [Candidatus Mycoplasma mahonii]WKX02302.1 tRNA (cytidine(34)-2'-O)-methyltransferase [Candidatus Mycoplasma mahonii]
MINIVLYQPEIPPNTGNIIRTCFATSTKLHIIKPTSFEIHPKWLKRPAAGKHLTDIEHEIHASFADYQKKYGDKNTYYITRYGAQYHSTPDFAKIKEDIFLMYGRESTGLPFHLLNMHLNKCLRVPMVAESRSLNLANTVMMTVYEVLRQKNYVGLSQFEILKGKDWIQKNKN